MEDILMYKVFSSGLLGSNSYIVWDEASREAMIVDLGNPPSQILKFARENSLTVKYLVLTHAHFDHAHFTDEFREKFPEARLLLHKEEIKVMVDPEANVSGYFGTDESYGYPDTELSEGDEIRLGETVFRVLHTPGHTPGSICLYSKADALMLTGDTLFMGGRGRCDFKYGSEEDMEKSLRRLLSMDGDTVFLSGHGYSSKIADERGRVF